jgi:hypothetical protein
MGKEKTKLVTDGRGFYMPIELFIGLLQVYKIITPEEASTALRTFVLPKDILKRLGIADVIAKN